MSNKSQDVLPVIPVAPQVSTASADNGGLIPETVAAQMQNDAVAVPPVYQHQDAADAGCEGCSDCGDCDGGCSDEGENGEGTPDSQFSKLTINIMFTLNLSNELFLEEAAKPLSKVETRDGGTINLYNPFKKPGKDATAASAGLFRPMLHDMLGTIEEFNTQKIIMVGSRRDTLIALDKAVATVRRQLQGLWPVVINVEPEYLDIANDVCTTTSWTNELYSEDQALAEHAAVINFNVNVGALYDAADRGQIVRNICSVLSLYADKHVDVPLWLCVAAPSDIIEYAEDRDFITTMLDEDGFELFSRKKLLEQTEEWMPNPTLLNTCLLTEGADMVFVKQLGSGEPEAELISEPPKASKTTK